MELVEYDQKFDLEMGRLLLDNAFLGEPFDPVCPRGICQEWFEKCVLGPYKKMESDNIIIALVDGEFAGYLTGGFGGKEFFDVQDAIVKQASTPFVAGAAFSMSWKYKLLAFYLVSQLGAQMRGKCEKPNHPDDGVHWHYQVDKKFRGRGVGSAMFAEFRRRALTAGHEKVWAEVNIYEERPESFFTDSDWTIFDRRPFTIFGSVVDFPVEILCIERSLEIEMGVHRK